MLTWMLGTLAAAQETVLHADRSGHLLVLANVYLNGRGPLRMAVDTGASSCAVRPAVARRLDLAPARLIELETAATLSRVAASVVSEMRVGSVVDHSVEVLTMEVEMSGVDGVLGQSWLGRHDYLLDYRGRRVVIDPPAPSGGLRTDLRSGDGRPEIVVDVDGRRQELVVDSGASTLVLYRPGRLSTSAMLKTNRGTTEVGVGNARVTIGSRFSRRMTTAEFDSAPRSGLLPAAAFSSVFVSNREGVVVLAP